MSQKCPHLIFGRGSTVQHQNDPMADRILVYSKNLEQQRGCDENMKLVLTVKYICIIAQVLCAVGHGTGVCCATANSFLKCSQVLPLPH